MWCVVWGFESSENEEDDFSDDYDPYEDMTADPLTYDKP